MIRVILPTSKILQQFKNLEPLFSYADDGVMGVIRDMVLDADSPETNDFSSREFGHISPMFCDNISSVSHFYLQEYENSAQAVVTQHRENMVYSMYVEIALANMHQVVREMISELPFDKDYEISKQTWDWLGNDMIINVRVYNRENARKAERYSVNLSRTSLRFPRVYWPR